MPATKAYGAQSATSPIAPLTIERREPPPHDVQIEILYCGVCHSDLHTVRNEWGNKAPAVTADVVKKQREATKDRSGRPWTAAELK